MLIGQVLIKMGAGAVLTSLCHSTNYAKQGKLFCTNLSSEIHLLSDPNNSVSKSITVLVSFGSRITVIAINEMSDSLVKFRRLEGCLLEKSIQSLIVNFTVLSKKL